MKILEMLVEVDGKETITTREQDLELIESDFNSLMYHKYVFKSKWVKRVSDRNLYDGRRVITFTLDNGCRYRFIISNN
jgi:hypothetical protein